MFSLKSAFVVASFAFLHLSLPGQVSLIMDRAVGAGAIESYYCEAKDELGSIEILRNVPRTLGERAWIEWKVFGETPEPVYRARLPFHSGGTIQRIDECRFLVSGYRYFSLDPAIGVGLICRIRLADSGAELVIEEQAAIEADPKDVLWDSEQGRLYFHDVQRGKLFTAPWAGWPEEDSTPNLPKSTELIEIANAASVPALGDSRGTLRQAELYTGGGVLFGTDPVDGAGSLYQICPLGPVWTVRELGPRPALWRVAQEELLGNDEIVVIGSQVNRSRTFAVQDMISGKAVTMGVIPAGERAAKIALPDQLRMRPGNPVRIVGEGLRPSNVLLPLLRAGEPIPSPSGTLTSCVLPAGAAAVGNRRDFAVGTELWFDNGAMRASLHLGFAVRDAEDQPIVDVGGGAALLDAELQLTIPAGSPDLGRFVNEVWRSIPIGDDDDLAGSVAYWQWIATFPDGSLACSDVVGHTIWPRKVGAGGFAAALSGDSGDARQRWRNQLAERGFQPPGLFRSLVRGLVDGR